jgi:hypothetical protein
VGYGAQLEEAETERIKADRGRGSRRSCSRSAIRPGLNHRFDEDWALFIFLCIARDGTAKLPAFAAVEEPLGSANGDDHFAFGA